MKTLSYLLPFAACLALAQGAPSTQEAGHGPINPILKVLDVNQDGVLDSREIANASSALKKLDKNGDGKLTPDEYRPPRPDGRADRLPPHRQEGPGKPKDCKLERPRPPLDTALDENGDEIISAQEIAKAPVLLKKLDLNRDGRLSREEYRPKPPSDAQDRQDSGKLDSGKQHPPKPTRK